MIPRIAFASSRTSFVDGCVAKLGIRDQHAQHSFKVGWVAIPEAKARPIGDLKILWDVTNQHTNAGTQGIEKR